MAILGGIFSDFLNQPWEQAREMVKEELEQLRTGLRAVQSRITVQLNLGDIQGDVTQVPRYIANTGTGNLPKWDLVNLATGVTGRVSLSKLPIAPLASLLGRQGGSGGDYQAISLGTGLTMTGTTLAVSSSLDTFTLVNATAEASFPSGYPALAFNSHFFVDEANALGEWAERFTSVPLVVGATSAVVTLTTAAIADLPASANQYEIQAQVTVSNLTGTQIFQADWTKTFTAGVSGGIDFSSDSPTTTAVAGSDLSWDSGSTSIKSTAGGIFIVYISYFMYYV